MHSSMIIAVLAFAAFPVATAAPTAEGELAGLFRRAVTTCTINSGQKGKCVATSACRSVGGKSEAGHCPGAADIQCCTSSSGGNCGPPNVNAATVALIKSFEHFVKSPAPDPIGLLTVGYGHLCKTKGCLEVPYKFPLTEAQAAALLQTDLRAGGAGYSKLTLAQSSEKCLADKVSDSVVLNDNQYGALVSWTFNVGCGNMGGSTLVRRLNNGENHNTVARQELPKWNKGGGKVLPGLTRRRNAEVELFQTASGTQALPAKC